MPKDVRGKCMEINYSEIMKQIAAQDGVTEEEVYEKMKLAITIGFHNLDPRVQEFWRRVAPDGVMPTPEQFIEIIANDFSKK